MRHLTFSLNVSERWIILILTFLLLCCSGGAQDRLVFDNGDVISGKFLSKVEGIIHFETQFLGVLKVSETVVQLKQEHSISQTVVSDTESAGTKVVQNQVGLQKENESLDYPTLPNKKNVGIKTPIQSQEKKHETALGSLWDHTENTLNRFVHDRVPEWFPSLPLDWKGEVRLGYDLSDTVKTSSRYSGAINLEGDKEHTNYKFKSYFAYAEQDDSKSEDDWGGSARFRYKLKNTDFIEGLTTYDVDNLYDPRIRGTASIGFGLKPINHKHFTFDYVIGGAWEVLDRREGAFEETFKVNINENLQWKFNKHLTLKQNLRLYLDPSSDMSYNFRFESGLKTLIIGAFNLGISYRLDFDSSVSDEEKRQKSKIVTSLGVKF